MAGPPGPCTVVLMTMGATPNASVPSGFQTYATGRQYELRRG